MSNREERKKTRNDEWMFKAPIELKRSLDRVNLERVRSGRDNDFRTYKRLGLAISRHEQLLNDLIKADLPEDVKK